MVYSVTTLSAMFSTMFHPSIPQELDALRSLDEQTVSAVYNRYFSEVFRYIYYRLQDEALAEDLSSEVFMRLFEEVEAGRGPRKNLRGWLVGTAHHVVMDYLRRQYRQPMAALHDGLSDPVTDPAEEVERQERLGRLRKALAGLTPEQQHVLALRFGQGLSLQETAALMKKSLNAVKQLQLRALAALNRQMLEDV